MKVSRLNKNSDWTFGKGKAGYLTESNAIGQNVVTRIRSFTRDWYADMSAGIDWFGLLGTRGIRSEQIQRQVRNTVLATEGVLRIDQLSTNLDRAARTVTINITITTIYNKTLTLPEIEI